MNWYSKSSDSKYYATFFRNCNDVTLKVNIMNFSIKNNEVYLDLNDIFDSSNIDQLRKMFLPNWHNYGTIAYIDDAEIYLYGPHNGGSWIYNDNSVTDAQGKYKAQISFSVSATYENYTIRLKVHNISNYVLINRTATDIVTTNDDVITDPNTIIYNLGRLYPGDYNNTDSWSGMIVTLKYKNKMEFSNCKTIY